MSIATGNLDLLSKNQADDESCRGSSSGGSSNDLEKLGAQCDGGDANGGSASRNSDPMADDMSQSGESVATEHPAVRAIASEVEEGGNKLNLGKSIHGVIESHPYRASASLEGWTPVTRRNLESQDLNNAFRPHRSMVLNFPIECWRQDATKFMHMQLHHNNEARCQASAQLASILFQGLVAGMRTGTACRNSGGENGGNERGGKAKSKAAETHARASYEFVREADNGVTDTLPGYQIGIEELYNSKCTEVVALRVWLFIIDPEHSTSALVRRVINDNEELANADCLARRSTTTAQTEAMRHTRFGCNPTQLLDADNFKQHCGMTYRAIRHDQDMYRALKAHSGRTANATGVPFVPDIDAHINHPAARATIEGDPTRGGMHPLCPEFVLNARRAQRYVQTSDGQWEMADGSCHADEEMYGGLRFGLAQISGSTPGRPLDVHHRQLDPNSYFGVGTEEVNRGNFKLPQLSHNGTSVSNFFWICMGRQQRSIFEMPLPNPLRGSVSPGPHLVELFLQERGDQEARDRARVTLKNFYKMTDPDMRRKNVYEFELTSLIRLTQSATVIEDSLSSSPDCDRRATLMQFRCMATRRDIRVDEQMTEMRDAASLYDQVGGNSAGDENRSVTTGEFGGTVVRSVSATKVVANESNRVHDELVQPWRRRIERVIESMKVWLGAREQHLVDTELRHHDAMQVDDWFGLFENDAVWKERNQLLNKLRDAYHDAAHLVMRDLTRYHLQSLELCFESTHSSGTIPAGFRAMQNNLKKYVAALGGHAHMWYNANASKADAENQRLQYADRSVWGHLMTFMRQIFVNDCAVEGRDVNAMYEIYFHMFEAYAAHGTLLVLIGEKGVGKSLQLKRVVGCMPDQWCSKNQSSTKKAGQHGGNDPSNGCIVVSEEALSDLIPNVADDRMEYWKVALTDRTYEREVSLRRDTDDSNRSKGIGQFAPPCVTGKVVTDAFKGYIMCCNYGGCFAEKAHKDLSDGKQAMVSRSVALLINKSGAEASARKGAQSDDDFMRRINTGECKDRVDKLRLLSCLVGFCKLAMMSVPWLQLDLTYAECCWNLWDKILKDTEGVTPPSARRQTKRRENMRTAMLLQSVAQHYLFGHTARQYASHRQRGDTPNDDTPADFEIGDLWEVIRGAAADHELILFVWSQSLEYNIATSTIGNNVMSTIAEHLGITVAEVLKRPPTNPCTDKHGGVLVQQDSMNNKALAPDVASGGTPLMHEVTLERNALGLCLGRKGGSNVQTDRGNVAAAPVCDGPQPPWIGTTEVEVQTFREQMEHRRNLQHEFHSKCTDVQTPMHPFDTIARALPTTSDVARYRDAMAPTWNQAAWLYNKESLIKWMLGHDQDASQKKNKSYFNPQIRFLRLNDKDEDGSTQTYDFSRIEVFTASERVGDGETRGIFHQMAKTMLRASNTIANALGMHSEGVADAIYQLASEENKRMCPQMPANMPSTMQPISTQVFFDAGDIYRLRGFPNPSAPNGNPIKAHEYNYQVWQTSESANHPHTVPVHGPLGTLVNNGRLPAMLPFVSANHQEQPPIQINGRGTVTVNSYAMFDHVVGDACAICELSTVPGMMNRTEATSVWTAGALVADGSTPAMRSEAMNAARTDQGQTALSSSPILVKLSWAHDRKVMYWTIKMAKAFHDSQLKARIDAANKVMSQEGIAQTPLTVRDVPQITHRFLGLPQETTDGSESFEPLRFLSSPIGTTLPEGQAAIDVATSNPFGSMTEDELRPIVEEALLRSVTSADIQEYKAQHGGAARMGDIKGDIHDVQTNVEATIETWRQRGFVGSMNHSYRNRDDDAHPLFDKDDPVLHNYADRLALTEVRIDEAREELTFCHNTYANTHSLRALCGGYQERSRALNDTLTKIKEGLKNNARKEAASVFLPGNKRQCKERP